MADLTAESFCYVCQRADRIDANKAVKSDHPPHQMILLIQDSVN